MDAIEEQNTRRAQEINIEKLTSDRATSDPVWKAKIQKQYDTLTPIIEKLDQKP